MDKKARHIKSFKMGSFLRAYNFILHFLIWVLSQKRTKTIKKKSIKLILYHTISIYDFLRPKVAINVELYLATAMNYYFHAVIGAQFTKHL